MINRQGRRNLFVRYGYGRTGFLTQHSAIGFDFKKRARKMLIEIVEPEIADL